MRLIDADKLMDTILLQDGVNTKTWEQVFKFTIRAIDNAPTVSFMISPDYVTELQNLNKELVKQLEEAERPHGKWILTYPYQDRHEVHRECSVCGDARYIDDREYFVNDNYCLNCGADMREEADNE